MSKYEEQLAAVVQRQAEILGGLAFEIAKKQGSLDISVNNDVVRIKIRTPTDGQLLVRNLIQSYQKLLGPFAATVSNKAILQLTKSEDSTRRSGSGDGN